MRRASAVGNEAAAFIVEAQGRGCTTESIMASNPALERDETVSLIASDKVEGTAVYDTSGKHIGKIERLMIDKRSGQVTCAVLSFGGLFGLGADHYPLPWPRLTYDRGLDGYRAAITEAEIKGAPKTHSAENWDHATARNVFDYWQVRYLWSAE
jgi:hypothetical protein